MYTLWLKRTTPQNIVIGGAAGCVPVLVAWAAVTGRVEVPALVLFAIVFYWTPPHFWALALRYRGDYAAAEIPMLPVVRGEAETARQIVIYTLLLVAVSLVLAPAAGMGPIYLVAAVALGAAVRRPRAAHPAQRRQWPRCDLAVPVQHQLPDPALRGRRGRHAAARLAQLRSRTDQRPSASRRASSRAVRRSSSRTQSPTTSAIPARNATSPTAHMMRPPSA